jgi:hypothetical protein
MHDQIQPHQPPPGQQITASKPGATGHDVPANAKDAQYRFKSAPDVFGTVQAIIVVSGALAWLGLCIVSDHSHNLKGMQCSALSLLLLFCGFTAWLLSRRRQRSKRLFLTDPPDDIREQIQPQQPPPEQQITASKPLQHGRGLP